jgi:hypothetical protein
MSRKKTEKCGTCMKIVSDKESDCGVQCEICEVWFHGNCQDVDENLYKTLSQYSTMIHWFCKTCNAGAGKILTMFANLRTKVDHIELELGRIRNQTYSDFKVAMKELDSKLDIIKKDFDQKVEISKQETMAVLDVKFDDIKKTEEVEGEQKEKTLWSELIDKKVEKKMNSVSDELKTVQTLISDTKDKAKEERDKEARRNNIIIYRVPESKADNIEERHQDDIKLTLKFLNESLQAGADKEDIVKVIRLGRFENIQKDTSNQEPSKTRPMLVMFSDHYMKNLVMNSLYKLKSASQVYKGFIVAHDMTEIDRLQCKTKVNEAKEKAISDKSGEWKYVVRGLPGQMQVLSLRTRVSRQ